jgi:hypothetical protein
MRDGRDPERGESSLTCWHDAPRAARKYRAEPRQPHGGCALMKDVAHRQAA